MFCNPAARLQNTINQLNNKIMNVQIANCATGGSVDRPVGPVAPVEYSV